MIEILDNVLNENELNDIKNYLMSFNFPWYFLDAKVKKDQSTLCSDFNNYQFCHMFYSDDKTHQYTSQYFSILSPLIQKINPRSISRIKANLTMRSDVIESYSYHTDTDFNCKTSIFYLNTNNGCTIFESGEKINSIENRMITFDSQLKHTGTTTTDQKFRLVLNFNYF